MAFNLYLLKMRFRDFMSSIKEINFALSAHFQLCLLAKRVKARNHL